ncbi:MAG: IclR family transcriptional regulator [Proteobacteria bacterium]|nr:IclR family transcriptional regulator [Pseudomonadota bacterium]
MVNRVIQRRKERTLPGRAAASSDRKGIQSVEIGIGILETLSDSMVPLSLKEIAGSVGLPPSNVHRYLASFVRTSMVRQDIETGHYDLGSASLRIGLSALNRLDAIELASNGLRELVQKTDMHAILSIWTERGPMIIRWQKCSHHIVISVGVGSFIPLLATSSGRVFLTHLPRSMSRPYLTKELAQTPANGKSSHRHEIEELITDVRDKGYAYTMSRSMPGLSQIEAIAAPVLDSQSQLAAVIALFDSAGVITKRNRQATDALLAVTDRISVDLGYSHE